MIPQINGTKKLTDEMMVFSSGQLLVDDYLKFAEVLVCRLRSVSGYEAISIAQSDGAADLSLKMSTSMGEEDYHLIIRKSDVSIIAGGEAGIAHGLTTLYWLIRNNSGHIPVGEIQDSPKMKYRGFLFDPCRHFFDVDTVKSMIEQASLRKLNQMHWHLSDDQGYRMESLRFPRLNTIGSIRTEMDGSISGGYYSFEEIKDIVQFAKLRGMEILPEIDMPGHVTAMIAAYPELSCSGENVAVSNRGGIHERILCAGKDETLKFVKELLDEWIPLFPYPYFHIGGDEAPKTEWGKCPCCQKRIKENNLANEESLQGWFTLEISRYLKSRGKTAVCWNEILRAENVDEEIIIQYWDEEDLLSAEESYCSKAFMNNRKCIYSNAPFLYLDYEPCLLPLRKIYRTEPTLRTGRQIPKENLLGMEATLWSERIFDRSRLEKMAFPRLFALADRTWSAENSYESFQNRCVEELEYLKEDGIAHFSMEEADVSGIAQMQAVIAIWKPTVDMAKAAGMTAFLPAIRRLISDKLQDLLTAMQLQSLLSKIFD